jgi:hypothetical protein
VVGVLAGLLFKCDVVFPVTSLSIWYSPWLLAFYSLVRGFVSVDNRAYPFFLPQQKMRDLPMVGIVHLDVAVVLDVLDERICNWRGDAAARLLPRSLHRILSDHARGMEEGRMASMGLTDAQFGAIMVFAGALLTVLGGWLTIRWQERTKVALARTQTASAVSSADVEARGRLYEAFERRIGNVEQALAKCEERCERQVQDAEGQRREIGELRRQNMRQGDQIAELKRQNAIQATRLAVVERKTIGDTKEQG